MFLGNISELKTASKDNGHIFSEKHDDIASSFSSFSRTLCACLVGYVSLECSHTT